MSKRIARDLNISGMEAMRTCLFSLLMRQFGKKYLSSAKRTVHIALVTHLQKMLDGYIKI